jgi:hypothetical protein
LTNSFTATTPDGAPEEKSSGGEVIELLGENKSWRADSNRGPADYELL